jgi:hypothetical protein
VIDTGTSSYVSLSNHLIENDVHRQIASMGKQVVVHAIIVGSGRTLLETLSDLDDLATQLPEEVALIVWLNEHLGTIGDPAPLVSLCSAGPPPKAQYTFVEIYFMHRNYIQIY